VAAEAELRDPEDGTQPEGDEEQVAEHLRAHDDAGQVAKHGPPVRFVCSAKFSAPKSESVT
jgi:hypothetical protein